MVTTAAQKTANTVNLLTEKNVEKARDYVKKQFHGCPNCGGVTVEIHSPVGLPLLVPTSPSGYTADKTVISAVPIICDNCGYITLVSAKYIIDL